MQAATVVAHEKRQKELGVKTPSASSSFCLGVCVGKLHATYAELEVQFQVHSVLPKQNMDWSKDM
jgi:hypothetical protein